MVGFCSREETTTEVPCALLLVCICIPTIGSGYVVPPEKRVCSHGEYATENGTCCNKCAPGFKFGAHCFADGQRTTCFPCPLGQYTEHLNYSPNCRSCRVCQALEEEVSKCRPERNRVCRCRRGYYKDAIDSGTSQCLTCSTCGHGERQTEKCSSEQDAVCECEKDFYRMKNKCFPCKNCSENCQPHCPSSVTRPPKDTDITQVVVIGMFVLIVLLAGVGLITHALTKRHTKSKMRRRTSARPDAGPEEASKTLIHCEEPLFKENMAIGQCIKVCEQELTKLPDCIPLEINIQGLIYAVLGLVPATRVKELARCLGVTDLEIERVEMDHRTCKEAHYQMLRVWAERGPWGGGAGRGGGVLHRPLMQELLDRLRDMHLGGAIEELEAKYGIVGGQVGAA